MHDAAQFIASRIKGNDYRIDDELPFRALARTGAYTIATVAYGVLRFPIRTNKPRMAITARVANATYVKFGRGVFLQSGSRIDGLSKHGIVIGNGSSVGKNTRIEGSGSFRHLGHGLVVGQNVGLGTDCFYGCAGGITIGDETIVGNFVSFHSENHNFDRLDVSIRRQGVTHNGIKIGKGCWIGAKATILDGANLEEGCVIAAGAVVPKGNYRARCVYGGVPARLLSTRDNSIAESVNDG